MGRDDLFVDTRLLRDHVTKLREEKKIALELYENIVAMKKLSDPNVSYQYNAILRDVEQLIEYFEAMARSLDLVVDEAVVLSHKSEDSILSDTEETRKKITDEFFL